MGLSKSKLPKAVAEDAVKKVVKIKEETELLDGAFVEGSLFVLHLVFFFINAVVLALNRAGSIKPQARGDTDSSLKMSQIKPLPKRRSNQLETPPEVLHLTKEAWFLDVASGNGNEKLGITKQQSEAMKKFFVLIEAPKDEKVRKD
jgi:hypothetical protein